MSDYDKPVTRAPRDQVLSERESFNFWNKYEKWRADAAAGGAMIYPTKIEELGDTPPSAAKPLATDSYDPSTWPESRFKDDIREAVAKEFITLNDLEEVMSSEFGNFSQSEKQNVVYEIIEFNKNKKSKGLKYDSDKPRMELLSTKWVSGVARVMGFGAKKYEAHNWRKGLERSRLIGAALRHIFAYLDGEDMDPESGLPHLDHASCCLMFAREQHETHPELDDRYKGKGK